MHAILLAAGRGRRLEADRPKCLLEIEGKTLLERHVMNLASAGVSGPSSSRVGATSPSPRSLGSPTASRLPTA